MTQLSPVLCAEHQWATAFRELRLCTELDDRYKKLVLEIERHLELLHRQHVVRVRKWLEKLAFKTANVTWKRNRNQYARLLLEQLRRGCLEQPFIECPPPGGLPTFPRWAASVHLHTPTLAARLSEETQHRRTATQCIAHAAQDMALSAIVGPHQPLNNSGCLDAYLDRQQAVEGLASRCPPKKCLFPQKAPLTGGKEMSVLPGTRITVGKPGGLPIKGTGEDSWQATKLELSAALGAARERGCELEWRLCQAERQLAHQAQDNGSRNRQDKRELDRLILEFEARQAGWSSPKDKKPSSKQAWPQHDKSISDEFGAFSARTATLRERLAPSGAEPSSDPPTLAPYNPQPLRLIADPPVLGGDKTLQALPYATSPYGRTLFCQPHPDHSHSRNGDGTWQSASAISGADDGPSLGRAERVRDCLFKPPASPALPPRPGTVPVRKRVLTPPPQRFAHAHLGPDRPTSLPGSGDTNIPIGHGPALTSAHSPVNGSRDSAGVGQCDKTQFSEAPVQSRPPSVHTSAVQGQQSFASSGNLLGPSLSFPSSLQPSVCLTGSPGRAPVYFQGEISFSPEGDFRGFATSADTDLPSAHMGTTWAHGGGLGFRDQVSELQEFQHQTERLRRQIEAIRV